MKKVVLCCVNSKGEPTSLEVNTSVAGKDLIYKFNEKNGYQCSIPVEVTFVDQRGETRTSVDNYAQHLLDSYSDEKHGFHFELVKEESVPAVIEKPKKKQKETKHEEVAG